MIINRDFAKPKKDYIKKNRILLIVLSAFVLISIVVMAVFGFNGNPDFNGCNQVSVTVGQELTKKELDNYTDKITDILEDNNLNFYSVQVTEGGENTTLIVKYTGRKTTNRVNAVNAGFMTELDVELNDISAHEYCEKTVDVADYIYTATAILIILVIATIFVIIRHNLAYALSMMGASMFGVFAIISLQSILHILTTPAFLFIVVGVELYTILESLVLFENMRQISSDPEHKDKKNDHIVLGFKQMLPRIEYTAIGMFVACCLLLACGTVAIKLVSISCMFAVIASLASFALILPFIYNLTIDKVKIRFRQPKVETKKAKEEEKPAKNNEKQEKEPVVEERYTDNPVDVEVVDNKAKSTDADNK